MTDAREQASTNKDIVRRIFEVVLPNPDASAEFEDLVADDFVDHDAVVPDHAHGVDSLRATHADLHQRLPGNVSFNIDELIAEDDLVAMRWSAGPAEAMVWLRLRDGKLTDRWAIIRRT